MKTTTVIEVKCFARRNLFAAFIGVLGILAAPREKAWANDVAHLETIYNTDYAAGAVGGLRDTTTATIGLSGISGTVNKAYLYWHGPMNSTNPLANATIELNHTMVTGVNIGYSDDNCWGFNNSQAYRADVTSLVRRERNGTYFLANYVKDGTNINANGASLLVFFNDNNPNNNRDIVLFDGNDSNADNFYDAPGWNVTLEGINYTSGKAVIQLHVSDGQIYEDADVVLNGQPIERRGQIYQGATVLAANNGPGNTGRLWDVKNYDLTAALATGTNTVSITHAYLGTATRLKGDCISLVAAVIDLPAGSAPPPPPANTPPVVTGVPEVIVNSPNAIPLQAQVSDQDGNALSYTIEVDGTMVHVGSIPPGNPVTTGTLDITNAFSLGQHVVVFTADDGQASDSFTTVVKVIDNTPPVLNVPANITVPNDPGKTNAVVVYVVTATDDFPGVTVLSLPASGTAFPIGVTTVTATAVDSSGNRVQKTFTVTVTDALPPVVNCPADILKPTDPGASNAVVRFIATAMDNLPGVSAPSCVPPSGSVFPLGSSTVTCSARDASGNNGSCTFMVTVVDREPPVVTVPANMTLTVSGKQKSKVVTFAATVRDNVPGATVACVPPSGASFPIGVTAVTCIGTDTSGNKATNGFTVTILRNVVDNRPPVVTVPANMTVPNDRGTNSAIVTYSVTVTDDQPGATVACAPVSGSRFPLGTTRVVCVGADTAGNKSTNGFNITVIDTEKPILTLPPNLVRPVDAGKTTAIVSYVATATDNSGSVSPVCLPPPGSAFPIGSTRVNCNAVDDAGNVTAGSFTVTVTNDVIVPPNSDCIITSKSVLWPPNHKLVPVSVWLNFGGKKIKYSSARIVSVTSNEPETGLWPYDMAPDWEIVNGKQLKLKLRAERDDHGNGRVYTITVEAKDKMGNEYLCKTTVTVPKDAPPKKGKCEKPDSGKHDSKRGGHR